MQMIMKDRMDSRLLTLAAIILLAALSRLLTNGLIPNFAPIGAIALFSGAYFKDKRMAFIVPVTAMLISDVFIGFHSTMIFVYAAFIGMVALGFLLRTNDQISIPKTAGVTVVGTLLFFFVTNTGVWMMYDFYPKNINGLFASWVAGIPFLRFSLLGDLFYVSLLFGAFEWIKRSVPSFNVALK
jgi:hypothetical protein